VANGNRRIPLPHNRLDPMSPERWGPVSASIDHLDRRQRSKAARARPEISFASLAGHHAESGATQRLYAVLQKVTKEPKSKDCVTAYTTHTRVPGDVISILGRSIRHQLAGTSAPRSSNPPASRFRSRTPSFRVDEVKGPPCSTSTEASVPNQQRSGQDPTIET